MFTSSVLARGMAALQGSETEQRIAVLLYDDAIQVISSFELNQLASLTYHDTANGVITSQQDMTDMLLDNLEKIQSQPIKFSVISVQKSLIVVRHMLLYGAESVVPRVRQQLGRHIEALCQYNTVLAAHQQTNGGAGSWLMRLQGGAVDQAGPIRASAVPVLNFLTNPQQLQFERNRLADPNSLVPVGTRQQVAFVSDAVRLEQLKKRMQEQQSIQTRSNLAKADNGFGSGYNAANGKTVVGAAHGIEEMLRQQQKEEQRFTDDAMAAKAKAQHDAAAAFSEYQAPDLYGESSTATTTSTTTHSWQQPQQADLLSMDNYSSPPAHAATVDLLDFGSSSSSGQLAPQQQQPVQTDLLFGSNPTVGSGSGGSGAGGTINQSIAIHDPFQSVATTSSAAPGPAPSLIDSSLTNILGSLSLGALAGYPSSETTTTTQPSLSITSKSVLSASVAPLEDRFSALDALTSMGGNGSTSTTNNVTAAAITATATSTPTFTTVPVPQPPPQSRAGGMYDATSSSINNAFGSLGTLGAASWNMSSNASSTTMPSLSMMQQQQQQYQQQLPSALDDGMAFAMPSVGGGVGGSSLRVSAAPMGGDGDDSDNGFLMGGASGMGLNPLGEAPAAPPPPPPPPGGVY
jgi:ENTH domain